MSQRRVVTVTKYPELNHEDERCRNNRSGSFLVY